MRKHTNTAALALLCVSAPLCAAEQATPNRVEHELRSGALGERRARTFTVALPASYSSQSAYAYPALYLLDGESNLDHAAAVTAFLADNALIPEMLIVAVPAGATRSIDYRPPPHEGDAERAGGAGGADDVQDTGGRGDRFLTFLQDELMPFVGKRYRVAPLNIITGHSLGGLFVTYALAERPGVFQVHIALSPYLNETYSGAMVERLNKAIEDDPHLGGFYYVTLGDEPDLEPGLQALEAALAGAPESLTWSAARHTGETHMSIRMVGLHDGLKRFFASTWPPPRAGQQALTGASLRSHIESLSETYGYPVLYNAQIFQEAAQRAFGRRDLPAALAAATLYAQQHDRSPVAHFLLAAALGNTGNREGAVTAIRAALRFYEENPRKEWRPLLPSMENLRRQLGVGGVRGGGGA